MGGRRLNIFILLFVAGILLGSALVVLNRPTVLGLDLKGGIELTLQGRPTPQVKEVTNEAMERSVDIIRSGCDRLGVSEIEISRLGRDQISVGIPGAQSLGKATECATRPAKLSFYDWDNNLVGPAALLTSPLQASGQSDEGAFRQQRQKWIDAGRLPTEGFNNNFIREGAEPTMWDAVNLASKQPRLSDEECDGLCPAGDKYYLFTDDKEHELLSGPVTDKADIYFDDQGAPLPKEGIVKKVPQGTAVVSELPTDPSTGRAVDDPSQEAYFVIQDRAELSGNEITNPTQQTDPATNQPNVTFEFTDTGREAFQEITRRIAQDGQARAIGPVDANTAAALSGRFAIVLDNQVVTRPIINFQENPDGIDGRTGAQISGSFDIAEAQELAEYLQRGALPIDLKLISQSQVSASLGQEALSQGETALAVGVLLVIIFLIALYRFLGVVASLALLAYGLIFFALVKLIPITMTLPGIAGLVLTIGVAADSNIVIFERIKEEMRAGRPIAKAVSIGYRKGIGTIIDANVIVLLTAFILFILATSGIRGFAFTLGVGTIVSLLTAVVFTQALLGAISNTKYFRSGRLLEGIEGKQRWRFDFMGNARILFAVSAAILVIGALALTTKGLNFGIDFESGTRIEVSVAKPTTTESLRQVVAPVGLGDAKIQELDNPALGDQVFQIRSSTLGPESLVSVEETISKELGVGPGGFSSTSIGPTFGQTVVRSAGLALILSLLLVTCYIAIRFGGKYTVPVLIAIAHDILIGLGIYALLGFEVSSATVAAFLTILGFSLYDTIIVFDRIRENEPTMPRATFSQIVNRSMNEVLTRSLVTGFSTLFGVISLLVFGGETLTAFAIAILVGIASGTYSSIFIASPVLALWKDREPVFVRRARQQREIQGYVPSFASDLEVSKVEDGEAEDDGQTLPATPGGAS